MTQGELTLTEALILDAENKSFDRDQVAMSYLWALRHDENDIDWPRVNAAIIDRWSVSGLEYIKARAWKWWVA